MAITAIAVWPPLAVMVVPSSGSRAMSKAGPPLPTFSPMNSIGASSRSPSPITTVPSISSPFSDWRMAFTAAWSAAFSSPRPIRRDAASAAASVTRTVSRARLRSIELEGELEDDLACGIGTSYGWGLEIDNADQPRLFHHDCQLGDAGERPLDLGFLRVVRHDDHRHRLALPLGAAALDHRFHRNVLEIGRAHVGTPVTNAHLVCRLHLA